MSPPSFTVTVDPDFLAATYSLGVFPPYVALLPESRSNSAWTGSADPVHRLLQRPCLALPSYEKPAQILQFFPSVKLKNFLSVLRAF